MAENPDFTRKAFSPGEFANLFGKSKTWGYRQIYSGKVKAITGHGRILIPAAEVEAILEKAGVYDGRKPKALRTKTEIQSLTPQLQNTWQDFLASRRRVSDQPIRKSTATNARWPSAPSQRQSALARLTRLPER